MLTLFNLAVQRLVTFIERHRASALVALALLLLLGGASGLVAVRPPFLAPAIDTAHRWLMEGISQPARLSKYFTGPRVSRERLLELELEVARLREAAAENRRLREMLGYRTADPRRVIPARIIGLDLDPVRGAAWIDAGTGRGVAGGEAVVTIRGLVGVVTRADRGSSAVRLLRSNESAVGVRDTRSRVLGVVTWSPGPARFTLDYIPKQADVAVGDTLLTSGLGAVFPAGLAVGRVASVEEPPERLLKEIRVEPFTAFHRLEEVFVLRPASPDSSAVPPSGEGAAP